jgi:hypothetical protein
MSKVDEPIVVVMSPSGFPERIIWRSQWFQVTDRPTKLGGVPDFVLDFLTHPPRPISGWRFQGTTDDGDTHMFDISLDSGAAQWRLVRTYD